MLETPQIGWLIINNGNFSDLFSAVVTTMSLHIIEP